MPPAGNKVFRFGAKSEAGKYVYVGIPQVNYGAGVVNVVNNVIRGAGMAGDTGLSYQAGGGESLLVLSGNNNVQSTGTPRTVGERVTLVNPL